MSATEEEEDIIEGVTEGFLEEVMSEMRLERRAGRSQEKRGRRMLSRPLWTPGCERQQDRHGHW